MNTLVRKNDSTIKSECKHYSSVKKHFGKSVVLFLLLTFSPTTLIFSNGISEKEKIVYKVENEATKDYKKLHNYTENNNLGTVDFFLNLRPSDAGTNVKKLKLAVYQFDNEYFDPRTGQKIDYSLVADLFRSFNTLANEVTFRITDSAGAELKRFSGRYYTGNAPGGLDYNSMGSLINNKSSLSLSLCTFGATRLIQFLLIYEDNSSEYINFYIELEFFKGENELFSNILAGKTYNEKAISFLNTFFPATKNLSGITDVSPIPVFPTLTEGVLQNYQNELRKAFISHLDIVFEEININQSEGESKGAYLPYLNPKNDIINRLYGAKSNIYISTYLKYIFNFDKADITNNTESSKDKNWEAKPLFSCIYESILNEYSHNTSFYNHRNYKVISRAEGTRIAKAALTYLTWGLEYTPYGGGDTYDLGKSGNPVFATNNNWLESWFNAGGNRTNNYLPRSPYVLEKLSSSPTSTTLTEPERIHILNGDYTTSHLRFVSQLKADKTQMEVSRIDFLTSENIAWEGGRVAYIIANDHPIIPGPDTSEAAYKIMDRKLALEPQQPAKDNSINYTIFRDETADNTIKVGYRFNKPEKISALILVRGWAESAPLTYSKSKYAVTNTNKPVQIEYLVNNERKYVIGNSVSKSNYIDYMYDYTYNYFVADNKAPGYRFYYPGLSTYYNKGNKHLSYLYISFPQPLEACQEITIIDKTGSSFLNISELMVFPEDPIRYLSEAASINASTHVIAKTNIKLFDFLASTLSGESPIKASGTEVEWEAAGEQNNNLFLLANGDFKDGKTINYETNTLLNPELKKISYIDTYFKATYDFKTIIVWEKNPSKEWTGTPMVNEPVSDLTHEVQVLYSLPALWNELTFTNEVKLASWTGLYAANLLTTPFSDSSGKKVVGNPLPYSPSGIDSPLTFNYKMSEQQKARAWVATIIPGSYIRFPNEAKGLPTTLAVDYFNKTSYSNAYVNEFDIFRADNKRLSTNTLYEYPDGVYESITYPHFGSGQLVKPFLPGYFLNNELGYSKKSNTALVIPDKLAGVDALGFLMGAISMSNVGGILNINNQNIPNELDKYYHMQDGAAGLDTHKRPLYYVKAGTSEQSVVAGNYRFKCLDFEKNTVLVADLNRVQPGDILIKRNERGEPHIGIVIDNGNTQSLSSNATREQLAGYLEHILVLSIKRGYRMVSLGSWGNPVNSFGGFTTNPEAYEVRRLLKNDALWSTEPEEDTWELVKILPEELDCELRLPIDAYLAVQNPGTNPVNHWVPNTGEALQGLEIEIGCYLSTQKADAERMKVALPEAFKDVVFLSPRDQSYLKGEDVEGNRSNVNVNKGKGIVIYLQENDNLGEELLRFKRVTTFPGSTEKEEDLRDNRYTIVYNDKYYESRTAGQLKAGYRLYVEGGKLTFKMQDKFITKFAIKPIEEDGASIRPGDDFLLRFGLAKNISVTGMAKDNQFVAMYDKKLLWRANLYIDEGVEDWNNLNPWVTGNDWNKRYADTNLATISLANMNLSSMSTGNGGQVINIFPFTPLYTVGGTVQEPNSNNYIQNKVAYDYPENGTGEHGYLSIDSPFDFNYKLIKQRNIIRTKYSEATSSPFTGIDLSTLKNWNTTKAPLNKWQNYVHGVVNTEAPHLPNLGLKYLYTISTTQESGAVANVNDLNSGVDCIGFAQRVASYHNNVYSWIDLPEGITEGNEQYGETEYRVYPFLDTYGWKISGKPAPGKLVQNLDKIIPGDIFYFTDSAAGTSANNDGHHIAIVNAVEYDNNSRVTNISKINLIESTQLNQTAYVIKDRNVQYYQNSGENWFVVRLR